MTKTIQDRVINLIGELTALPSKHLGMDSLEMSELRSELANQFQIEVPDDADFRTVADVIRFVDDATTPRTLALLRLPPK